MKQKELLKKIKAAAQKDAEKRKDPRFLQAMGFLVAKGFLNSNYPLPRLPNQRLKIADVLWAGTNVEARILEVLPAAVLRLPRHFDFDPNKHQKLAQVLKHMRKQDETGPNFYDVPYDKVRVWAELALKDGRSKVFSQKKVTKTFRLSPEAIRWLKKLAAKNQCSETEIIESIIAAQS